MRNKLALAVGSAALIASALSAVAQAQAARDYIFIVGSSTVCPFATVVTEQFGNTTRGRARAWRSGGTRWHARLPGSARCRMSRIPPPPVGERPPHEPDRRSARLLARLGDDTEAVEVRETGDVRWLQFGAGAIQSLMHLREPDSLVLPYTRALLCWMLFGDPPRDALMLGLGGGSLVRWLQAGLPELHLTVVENDARVVQVARTWFRIPADGPRLRIVIDDAREALRTLPGQRDLLLLDVFDAEGMPAWLTDPSIYTDCAASLAPGGVMCANLWARDQHEFVALMRTIRDVFDGRVLCVPVSGYYNVVVLGFARAPAELSLAALTRRAQVLGSRHHVEFPHLLDQMAGANLTLDGALVL